MRASASKSLKLFLAHFKIESILILGLIFRKSYTLNADHCAIFARVTLISDHCVIVVTFDKDKNWLEAYL